MIKVSIIIPTYNRPRELRDCIRSILDQTVRVHEIIVIDDGDLRERPLEQECTDAGIRYLYHKKNPPGLTASRNAGVKLAEGDIIFFLDDDVVLFPQYVEEILITYGRDRERLIGGVGGVIANTKRFTFLRYLIYAMDLMFLVSGTREGCVLPSGFCTSFGTSPFPIERASEVDFLAGCGFSFKKEIFEEFSFSERYKGYGWGEDKDFSYRVSKCHRLLVTPHARLYHFESPMMRYDKFAKGREFVLWSYAFFREHFEKKPWSRLLFGYALFGYALKRMLIMFLSGDWAERRRMKGIFSAVREILR